MAKAQKTDKEFVKCDRVESERRVYVISRMLRYKPIKLIIEHCRNEWNIEKAQAYHYINAARKEWTQYYKKLKFNGMAYHAAQLRDLKDNANMTQDWRLMLDITREEAKLMGIYPTEKLEITEKKVVVIGGTQEEIDEANKTEDISDAFDDELEDIEDDEEEDSENDTRIKDKPEVVKTVKKKKKSLIKKK